MPRPKGSSNVRIAPDEHRCVYVWPPDHESRAGERCPVRQAPNSHMCGRHQRFILGRNMSKEQRAIQMIPERYRDFVSGALPVEDLTWEELTTGKINAADGSRRGAAPQVIPGEFYTAIHRELIRRMEQRLREDLEPALAALREIVQDKRATSVRDRREAAQYLLERTMGKIPERTESLVEIKRHEQLMSSGELVVDIGEDDEDIQDAEVLE